ncbi:MAG: endonuclease/exonuclease/phosphatase family protein [Mongoliibacter sp.]|uniref:endonuclease/exonuclease/phosphatase family protein n=1 Tax=Mongoliibacter sp. TaxID=2022438 RepID=UPI0012F13CD2|nr:endonuclease/exonuclease/phosphatase family protein [Mongoliibacter sp.]TVP53032.1 MAG: endonuclease/exonuclease/phosphatase family protein [Mongoliibacter sp.]
MVTALIIISLIMILATFIPVIKKDHWTFRIFDYPRFQKITLCSLIVIAWLFFDIKENILQFAVFMGLILSVLYLAYQIFPFTPFGKKMVQNSKEKNGKILSVMVINVYQYNNKFQKVIDLLKIENPDLFLLVETDQNWTDQIQGFKKDYPFFIEVPKDNTYGMLFFSKIEIKEEHINYLIEEDVPSIEVTLNDPDFGEITIFALHPTPPVPSENPSSTERDAEILLVGKKIKNIEKPVLVLGDLNDVGWSYTSELFLKVSGMLDPRRGRGMFSTFHAKYFFMRWPLDHIFVSKHFTLKSLKIHQDIGSDHFPMSGHFKLNFINDNEGLKATLSEKLQAKEKIQKA